MLEHKRSKRKTESPQHISEGMRSDASEYCLDPGLQAIESGGGGHYLSYHKMRRSYFKSATHQSCYNNSTASKHLGGPFIFVSVMDILSTNLGGPFIFGVALLLFGRCAA